HTVKTGFSYKCRFHHTLLLCFSIAQNTIKKKNDPSVNKINSLSSKKRSCSQNTAPSMVDYNQA
ncbi:hypothetical protein ACLI2D_13835, partial [Enterococcus faecalis]|uniref:hypothetical protein n=1 Tax=Enterococcus faecalis TaxID=1351 RepID=UPI003984D122